MADLNSDFYPLTPSEDRILSARLGRTAARLAWEAACAATNSNPSHANVRAEMRAQDSYVRAQARYERAERAHRLYISTKRAALLRAA